MISKIRRGIRRAANAVNVEIHRYRPWQWSCSVETLSSDADAEMGLWQTCAPQIAQILDGRRNDISVFLGRMSELSGILKTVPLEGDPNRKRHIENARSHISTRRLSLPCLRPILRALFRNWFWEFYKIRTPHD